MDVCYIIHGNSCSICAKCVALYPYILEKMEYWEKDKICKL